jgi:16S rRNA A1518/A1519 N6-dimethyltransferase RsmA/KsgA/DIM1 with predicted DNA glycosylase/AP lyase activity
LTVVEGDILDVGDADVLPPGDAPVRIVGNLPYNLSSPILLRILALARATGRVTDAIVMLQREVADRVLAEPGGGDYGPLAVVLGLYADRTRLLALPPGAFRPPPEVHSAVVRLAFRAPTVRSPGSRPSTGWSGSPSSSAGRRSPTPSALWLRGSRTCRPVCKRSGSTRPGVPRP